MSRTSVTGNEPELLALQYTSLFMYPNTLGSFGSEKYVVIVSEPLDVHNLQGPQA